MAEEIIRWTPAENLQEIAEQLIMTIQSRSLVDGCSHGLYATQCFDAANMHFTMTIAVKEPDACEVCQAEEPE